MIQLRQAWPLPSRPRPIVVVGAGAIVRTAHLPSYRRLAFPVAGVFDIRPEASEATAREFGVSTVFPTLDEACAKYTMSADEFFAWENALHRHGLSGLRATSRNPARRRRWSPPSTR